MLGTMTSLQLSQVSSPGGIPDLPLVAPRTRTKIVDTEDGGRKANGHHESGSEWIVSGSLLPFRFCDCKHRQAAMTGVGSWPTADRHLANSSRVSRRLEDNHIVSSGTAGLGSGLWVLGRLR